MSQSAFLIVGRYSLHQEIACGGMASVHYGKMLGPAGFSRIVAIKRLHPQLAKEPEFVAMLLDEARLTARIRHPNVVSIVDVVAIENEVLLVMDYVHGESLARLLRASAEAGEHPSSEIVSAVMSGVLHGLYAAHTTTSESGEPLQIVHRDLSPQNVLVGQDGTTRVVDFGVASAIGRLQTTREGQIKGKPAYMAPEQIRGDSFDSRVDVWAASVLLWECLTLRRLFSSHNDAATINKVLTMTVDPPSRVRTGVPKALDAIVAKGLERDPERRFRTAKEMALAIEEAFAPASTSQTSVWVESLAHAVLEERASIVSSVEKLTSATPVARPEPSSAVSPDAVTDTTLTSEPRRRRRPLLSVAVLLLVATIAGLALYWSRTSTHEPVSPATSAGDAAPLLLAESAVAGEASTKPAPSSVPSAVPSATARVTPRLSAPPKHANCNPPTYVDARGVIRLKRECLTR
jgi:serine/threonine protein kinase